MAIALIALLLIELLLLALWAPFFFRTGIALFNQRIAATPAELAQLSLAGLEHDLPPDTWLCLVLRALPDGSIAFRESFVPSIGRRYFPLMRGRVMIDARRREVRVVGLCSWFALGPDTDAGAGHPRPTRCVADAGGPGAVLHRLFHPAPTLCRGGRSGTRTTSLRISEALGCRAAVDPRHAWMIASAGISADQRSAPTRAGPGSRSTPCVDGRECRHQCRPTVGTYQSLPKVGTHQC